VKRILAIVIGALVGGYGVGWLTALVCCTILFPDNNLCGLPAAFIGAPAGLVAGGITGALLWRKYGGG
jgi:hypothetical protein